MAAVIHNCVTLCVDLAKFLIDIPYFIYLYIYTIISSIFKDNSRKDLSNDVVLVTGAASGIGQQIVYKLAKLFPNASYILWDINEAGLSETYHKLHDIFGVSSVFKYKVDLSKRSEIVKYADLVRQQVGPVTVLINNAGLANYQRFLETDVDTEEMVIKVNLLSYMWTVREFLPEMVKAQRGHLIQTCSGLGFYRFSHHTAYCASKFGLRGFIESLKLEVAEMGDNIDIKFTTIFPGFVKTPMTKCMSWTPRYSILQPLSVDQAAEEIVEGILTNKEEIMVPGGLKLVDLFHRFFPKDFVNGVQARLFQNLQFTSSVKHSEK